MPCRHCNKIGHNIRTCPELIIDFTKIHNTPNYDERNSFIKFSEPDTPNTQQSDIIYDGKQKINDNSYDIKEKLKSKLDEELVYHNIMCNICYDDTEHNKNLEIYVHCQNNHYYCNQCISSYIKNNSEIIYNNKGKCPCPDNTCDAPPMMGITKYIDDESWHTIFNNVNAQICNKEEEGKMYSNQLKEANDMIAKLKAELDKKNAELGNQISIDSQYKLIDEGVKRIYEIIKNTQLHCPRCKTPYTTDHNGCQAVKCAVKGCNCGFCPLCLKDCGRDAHSHFTKKECPYILKNESRSSRHMAFQAKGRVDAKQAEQNRRREALTDYLLTINNANIRNTVIQKCRKDFIDVNMTNEDINSWIISDIYDDKECIRQLDDETRIAMAIAQSLKE